MPAFEALTGMPYWITLLSSDPEKSARFYSAVFNWEISQGQDGYRIARYQGMPVAGIVDKPEGLTGSDAWITYFLVDNMEETLAKVEQLGGQTVQQSQSDQGWSAFGVDVSGALFGLMEATGEGAFIAAGEPSTTVWHELVAAKGFGQDVEFYEKLFSWTVEKQRGPDYEYATALIDGAPFLGMLNAEKLAADKTSFWRPFFGTADLTAFRAKAPEYGAEIAADTQNTEFGKLAVITDPTGVSINVCEVDEPEMAARESDNLLDIDLTAFEEEFRNQK